MKNVNDRQKDFYQNFNKNFVTRIWFKIRNSLFTDVRKDLDLSDLIYSQHKEWFGNLSRKKVLDLGCYAGNALSYYLAENSKEYIGIDLSEKAISILDNKIKHLPNAKVRAVDFLTRDFEDKDFDLIYAYGVLHHFKNTEQLIDRLNEKLSKNGEIISYDPLNTSIPIRFARFLYRPFQSDKDWEWPFTRQTVQIYKNSFTVLALKGVLGAAKWYSILQFLPLNKNFKYKKAISWRNADWNNSSDSSLYRCMQVTMFLKKRN